MNKLTCSFGLAITLSAISGLYGQQQGATISINDLTETPSIDHSGFSTFNSTVSSGFVIGTGPVGSTPPSEIINFSGGYLGPIPVPGIFAPPEVAKAGVLTEAGGGFSDFLFYIVGTPNTDGFRTVRGMFVSLGDDVNLATVSEPDIFAFMAVILDLNGSGTTDTLPESGQPQDFSIPGTGLTVTVTSDVEGLPDSGPTLGLLLLCICPFAFLRSRQRK